LPFQRISLHLLLTKHLTMKKHLLALSIVALAFTVTTTKAQIINAASDDFETWSPDVLVSSANDPNGGSGTPGWQCFNILNSPFAGSSPISVTEENTIVHSGSHSCKITSVVLTTGPSGSYNYVKAFVPHDTCGIVVGGTIVTSPTPAFKLGLPFTNHITSLSFWYQYMPATGAGKPDTGFCSVVLTHKHHVLGAGKYSINNAASWTQGTVNIVWDSLTGTPDSALIFFSSSSFYKPVPGSILYVDGATVTGFNELHNVSANVNVYPNPSSTEISFAITSSDIANRADIYDITGQKVSSYEVKNNFASVSTANYAPGLYLYQIYDKSGSVMKIGKFSVSR